MRPYLFGNELLRQHRFIELGCNLLDVMLFEHLYQAACSGRLTYISKKIFDAGGNFEKIEYYYYFSYNKLKDDMPILYWGERSLRNCITKLENVGLIKRYEFTEKTINSKGQIIMPKARFLYIKVAPEILLESPEMSVPGHDLTLKNYIVNRDINQLYVPNIKYKDNEYIYYNPGMQLDSVKAAIEPNMNLRMEMHSGIKKNLKAQLTDIMFSYFEVFNLKILNNSTIKIEYGMGETVKPIIEKVCFKLEQAIVDTYKQLYTKKIVFENYM